MSAGEDEAGSIQGQSSSALNQAESQSKNKKKKEKKKQQKNKREVIDRIFNRNASAIKCPMQLEQEGIIVDMNDIKLTNHNPVSRNY